MNGYIHNPQRLVWGMQRHRDGQSRAVLLLVVRRRPSKGHPLRQNAKRVTEIKIIQAPARQIGIVVSSNATGD